MVSLIFLKRSLVFPILFFSSIYLHWLLKNAFLSLLAILWNSAFRCLYLSFSPLLFAFLLFTAVCKASPDSHFGFLHFFSMGMVLKIAVKRKEVKSKGEKEWYKHLNAEFQRKARRDKKAFLSYQCKEIEENNRMGKTRDLVKKIRDTKGTFHAKMGSIKDRNGMELTEAEDIKKRW